MSHSIDRRERGRAAGSSLEMTDREMRELSAGFVALTEEYFQQVAELPVFPAVTEDQRLMRACRSIEPKARGADG